MSTNLFLMFIGHEKARKKLKTQPRPIILGNPAHYFNQNRCQHSFSTYFKVSIDLRS